MKKNQVNGLSQTQSEIALGLMYLNNNVINF